VRVAGVGDTGVTYPGAPGSGIVVRFPLWYTSIGRAYSRAVTLRLVRRGRGGVGSTQGRRERESSP